ncbi:RNA-directed DNA polymerase, eukaryota, reverse transcriptase zinc-binding domain protein, partial [Tanacetum coccineum]
MCKAGYGRLGFARVLIDVEAEKGLPDRIDIIYKNRDGLNCVVRPKTMEEFMEMEREEEKKKQNKEEFEKVRYKRKHEKKLNQNGVNKIDRKGTNSNTVFYKPMVKESTNVGEENRNEVEQKKMIDKESPKTETRLKGDKVKKIGERLFGRWNWYDNSIECSRGCRILVGWDSEKIQCSIISGKLMKKLWNDLNIYKAMINDGPYVIIGDLNVSLNLDDHSEGISSMTQDMEEFKECISDIKMEDIYAEVTDVEGYAMFKLAKKLKSLKPAMNKLNCKNGNLFENVKKLKKDLDEVQTRIDVDPTNSQLREQGVGLFKEYTLALKDEEKLLLQKSKVEWLKEGDGNSAYSHKVLRAGLTDAELSKIDNQEACRMINEVSNKEIKEALFDIDDNKAPGPDMKEFFSKGKLLKELNATLITLVPKLLKGYELLKGYDCVKGPKRWSMKIDIQKAYDTVNWKFLENALRLFGFHIKMVYWIMTYVTTPSYTICLNGERHGYFKGGRGLRQGDPLSPYLFTLIMEVFNMILHQEIIRNGRFKYHHGCKELEITHLCFADDLLVLCHGDINSVQVIKNALEKFSVVSRLYPNLGKSTIFCGSMDRGTIDSILQILPFKRGKLPDWKNKSLSYAGRTQLIASVLSSIQVYWDLVFKLPKMVINDIEKLFKGFLWNSGDL